MSKSKMMQKVVGYTNILSAAFFANILLTKIPAQTELRKDV